MPALTKYLESGLLNHIFRSTPFIAPSTLYVGLNKSFVSGHLENGIIDEPSGGSYIRQGYASSGNMWTEPSDIGISNTTAIHFPAATANIGEVSGVFISDSLISGNILFYGALNSARNIREGDQFVFPSGSLKITFG